MSGWVERDAAVVWHGFTQMSCYGDNQPIVVDRAEGRELIDADGRRYFDAISSVWVNTLGHRVPELDAAIVAQLGKVAHSTMLGNGNTEVVRLAEELSAVVPVDQPHFLFASDGAAAVEQALKIAFQYWANKGVTGRCSYLAFSDAYHGDTIGAISAGAGGFGTDVFDPLRFPVLRAPGFDDPECFEVAASIIDRRAGEIAAVVVEPLVQGAAGILSAPPERFAALAQACARNDVLLICDEVATGFGRTGTLFASEQCGLRPDIMCVGKGITGGYLPMSATVVSDRVFEAFLGPDLSDRTLYHGHSYAGNALAAAVARRHLSLVSEWDVLANVRARSEQLRPLLADLQRSVALVIETRLVGLMCAVVLDVSSEPLTARRTAAAMVRRGVLARSIGDSVVLVPPLTTTADEIERVMSALRGALEEVGSHERR